MKQGPLETDYVHALLSRAPLEFSTFRLFRRNTGTIQLEERVFRAGIPGQCDLYAIERGTARHFEIECKRYGRLSEAQARWREHCAAWGWPWLLLEVRRGELPAATLVRWVDELRVFFGATAIAGGSSATGPAGPPRPSLPPGAA